MELALNLGWALVAVWMLCAWMRTAPRKPTDRRIQMVALAMVILILLPAISMTDDLAAVQNPAEIDCCVRRTHDQNVSSAHFSIPAAVSFPLPRVGDITIEFAGMVAPGNAPSSFVENHALDSIENRPPPTA